MFNPIRATAGHAINCQESKTKNFESSKRKEIIFRNSYRTIGFLNKIFQTRGEWDDIFKILIGKQLSVKNSMPANLLFKNEVQVKTFLNNNNKKNLRELRPVDMPYC